MQRWYYSVRGRFFLFTISLHIYFQWWESGKVKKRSAPCFPLFTKKKEQASNYTKSLKYNGGFHFGVVCFIFLFSSCFFRLVLISLTRFCFTRYTHTPPHFLFLLLSRNSTFFLLCIAWWQRMTMVYTHTHTHFISTEMTIIYMWRHCLK